MSKSSEAQRRVQRRMSRQLGNMRTGNAAVIVGLGNKHTNKGREAALGRDEQVLLHRIWQACRLIGSDCLQY